MPYHVLISLAWRSPTAALPQAAHVSNPQPQGFLALPRTQARQGVLVLHPWWGLNETMRAFCSRLADEGFLAFAPDLYHGKIASSIKDAESLVRTLDSTLAMADISLAVAFLGERVGQADSGLAAVGFSLGASYALELSVADPDRIRAVVVFYGTGPGDYSASKSEYLGHFAEADEYEPRSAVDELEGALRRAGRPTTFYHYSGTGHWFFEEDRRDAYNQQAAALAWERTLGFLRRLHPSQPN